MFRKPNPFESVAQVDWEQVQQVDVKLHNISQVYDRYESA